MEYTKSIVNENGERVVLPMSKDEIAEMQALTKEYENKQIEATAKEAARQAVLEKLGLTADEAAALLG
jgi:hypothetical protein